MSQERIGFLVGRDYDVVSSKPRVRTIIVPGGHSDAEMFAARLLYRGVSLKLLELLARKRTQRSQIDGLSIPLKDVFQNTDLGDQSLAARGGACENEVLPV